MTKYLFPIQKDLEDATLMALRNMGGIGTIADIKREVINILELTEDVINLEHPDGTVTLLDYRLRWARTKLKGKIEKVDRGLWKINNDFVDS